MKRQDSGKSTLKTSENISRKKLLIFKVSAVLLALIFIILLEVFLRLIGYGSDFPLFTEPENKPGYIYMNPEVSNKYFFGTNNATAGYRELFKAEKDSADYLIIKGLSNGFKTSSYTTRDTKEEKHNACEIGSSQLIRRAKSPQTRL